MTFVGLSEKEIDDIEKYVKSTLKAAIVKKENPIDFYGQYYAKNPSEFEFSPGERAQIKLVSNYADRNATRKPGGYRYETDVKRFVAYLRQIAGPLAYHTLQRNLRCALPSLSAINKYIQKSNCRVTEGILRSDELLLYLNERKLDLVISLSEDATGITGRLQYDSSTNQIMGFVLPISSRNGMPIPFTYKARNALEIAQHFDPRKGNEVASNVTAVMAQPVVRLY